MKILIMAFALMMLGACASITGNARYEFESVTKVDGTKECRFSIDSGRQIEGAQFTACGTDGVAAGASGVHQGNSAIDVANMVQTISAVATGSLIPTPIKPAAAIPAAVPVQPAKPPDQ